MHPPLPTVFIGSSKEKSKVAHAIEVHLEEVADTTVWTNIGTPGKTFYDELGSVRNKFDFAIFVLSPDDVTHTRGKEFHSTRDNVIFELGLFIGSIGADRVYAVTERETPLKVMSDYMGVHIEKYRANRPDNDLRSALSAACVKIREQIEKIGRLDDDLSAIGEEKLFGLEGVYQNYESAKETILTDLRGSLGPIRLFFHIAANDVSFKGPVFEVLQEITDRGGQEVRILHASPDSPYFAKDRLNSLGKKSNHVIKSLNHVTASLKDLQDSPNSSLRIRRHNHPFIWRIYGFSERLYLMPYFSLKDATKSSPVLAFKNSERSMYHSYVEWFDHVWESAKPQVLKIDELITPATPAGAALFLKWNGFNVFGIPKRDLIDKVKVVRFYGIGGKRKTPSESLDDCARREGREETGHAVNTLTSAKETHFFRADGTIQPINVEATGPRPRLIYEKRDHSGYGSMKKSDGYYYMVGFEGMLDKEPEPTHEMAALLFLTDEHLTKFGRRMDITLGEILSEGAQIKEQNGSHVDREKKLSPHGTASFLIRTKTI